MKCPKHFLTAKTLSWRLGLGLQEGRLLQKLLNSPSVFLYLQF